MATDPLAPVPTGVEESAWLAACSAVRRYCGWHIAPTLTQTIRVRTSGRVIVLPSLLVQSVSQVSIRGSLLSETQWELMPEPVIWLGEWPSNVSSSNLEDRFEWLSGLDIGALGIHHSDRPVVAEVSMSHGFDECPGDILGVLLEAAQYESGSPFSRVGMVMSGRSAMPSAAGLVRERSAILDGYRLARLP